MVFPKSDGKGSILEAEMAFLLLTHFFISILCNMESVMGSPSLSPSDYSDSSSVEMGRSNFPHIQPGSSDVDTISGTPSPVLIALQNYLRKVQMQQRYKIRLAASKGKDGVMESGFGRLFSSRQKRESGDENATGKEDVKEEGKDTEQDAEEVAEEARKNAEKEPEKEAEKDAEKGAEKETEKEADKATAKGSEKKPIDSEGEEGDDEEDPFVQIDFDDPKSWAQSYPQCDPRQNKYTSPVDISTKDIDQVKGIQTLIVFTDVPKPETYVLSTMFHSDDDVNLEAFSIRLRNENLFHDGTYLTGLGRNDHRYFDSALFFIRPENTTSSPSQLPSSRRGHTIDKKEFPLEVMFNFKSHAGNEVTQIHVLVEIGEEENPVWRPIQAMLIPLIENVIHDKCYGVEMARQHKDDVAATFKVYIDELSKQKEAMKGSTYKERYTELSDLYDLIKDANEKKMAKLNRLVDVAKKKKEQCKKEIPEIKDRLLELEQELREAQDMLKLAIVKYEEALTTVKPKQFENKTTSFAKSDGVSTSSSTTTSSTPEPLDSVDESVDGGDSQEANAKSDGVSTSSTTTTTTTSTPKPLDLLSNENGDVDSEAKVNTKIEDGSTKSTTTATPSRRKRDLTEDGNEATRDKVDPKNQDGSSSSTSTTTTLSSKPKLDSTDYDSGDAKRKVKNEGGAISSSTTTTTTMSSKPKLDSTDHDSGDAKGNVENESGAISSSTTTMSSKPKLDSTDNKNESHTNAKNKDGVISSSTTTVQPISAPKNDVKTEDGPDLNKNVSQSRNKTLKIPTEKLLKLSMSLKKQLPTKAEEGTHTLWQEIKKLEKELEEKNFELRTLETQLSFSLKCIPDQERSARVLQLQIDTFTRLLEYYRIGSEPEDLYPTVEAVKVEMEKVKISWKILESLKEDYEFSLLQMETVITIQERSIPLVDPFHISWLFPARGGHYFYNGSSPIPPCNRRAHVIVFEDRITISKAQWRQFHQFPAIKQKGEGIWEKLCTDEFETLEEKLLYVDGMEKMTNQVPEIAPLGRRTIWFNLRNLQYKGDDGLHMLSRVRRLKKWKPS